MNNIKPNTNQPVKDKFKLRRFLSKLYRSPIFKIATYLLAAVFLWQILTSSLVTSILNIRQIDITGVGTELINIDPNRIQTTLEQFEGINYFSINLSDIPEVIYKEEPFAKRVVTTKQFPSTISLQIEERLPFILLQIDKTSCVLLDQSSYVLKVEEYMEENSCTDIASTYYVPILLIRDTKIDFKENTQSTYYVLEEISEILTVLDFYNYKTTNMILERQVLDLYFSKEKFITYSLAEDIQIQNQRFVVVIKEIQSQGIEFQELDVRYNRPVLKK